LPRRWPDVAAIERYDHAAYFRTRYGPAVTTVVDGTRFECRDDLVS